MKQDVTQADDLTRPATLHTSHWRVVDIVVAAVLGVAIGLVFWVWNTLGGAWYAAMNAATPGLGGIATGIWYLGGPLGAFIIRKPGAAIFVELLAAIVSTAIGNQWGIETLSSGIFQGLGAEIIFFIVRYRIWVLPLAMISGAGSGFAAWFSELFIAPNLQKTLSFNVIYLITNIVSGAILGGLVAWCITRALAGTGVLSRFVAGQDRRNLNA